MYIYLSISKLQMGNFVVINWLIGILNWQHNLNHHDVPQYQYPPQLDYDLVVAVLLLLPESILLLI
ncbi:Uncharacterised protein [Chlamydia trachomatis]|nr:Uncharacterised protein [Chlamydia trachomatis]